MNNKVLIAALILLTLLNAACLWALWSRRDCGPSGAHHPRGHHGLPPGPPQGAPGGPLPHDNSLPPAPPFGDMLGWDAAQRSTFDSLFRTHITFVRQLEDSLFATRAKLYAPESISDSARASALTQEAGQLQAGMDAERVRHFRQVWDLCTEEQRKHFDQVLAHVKERLSRRPSPR